MKLKTLKDFENRTDKCSENCNCQCHSSLDRGCDDCNEDNLLFDELKQEAIKHIKELTKKMDSFVRWDDGVIEETEGSYPVYPVKTQGKIDWIKDFFNIKKEDLK